MSQTCGRLAPSCGRLEGTCGRSCGRSYQESGRCGRSCPQSVGWSAPRAHGSWHGVAWDGEAALGDATRKSVTTTSPAVALPSFSETMCMLEHAESLGWVSANDGSRAVFSGFWPV